MFVAPRFKKVFQSPNLPRLLKYHAVRQQEREQGDLVYDVQDTQFWRRMYSQYSMCPLSLQILNFPSADERILLWSVLPGTKKPKSLSTYLGPLVDQLLQLEEGVECYHSDTRERFKQKARCVCDILDYKGQQMFLNTLGQNAFQGCKKCQKPGTYLPILVKVVYTDSKTFLLINHPLRSESGPIFPLWRGGNPSTTEDGSASNTSMVLLMKGQRRMAPATLRYEARRNQLV